MSCTKAALVALALAACAPADASVETRSIQYRGPNVAPTVNCAVGIVCEIDLGNDETITRVWNGQAQGWGMDTGALRGRKIITLKPEMSGWRTNLIIITTQREYRIWLVSYDGAKQSFPFDTQFLYDVDDRQRAQARAEQAQARAHPRPAPPPPAPTVAQQMDAACAKMPADEQYGIDPQSATLHPEGLATRGGRSVCHTLDGTYIQMPLGGPEPTDIPVVLEDSADGPRTVNAPYDPTSRIFHIDDVATEYTLALGSGKHAVRMRIQRQIGGSAAACSVPQKGKS
jgi:hypothetical protein